VLPIVVDKHNHGIDSIRYALQPLIKPHQAPSFIFVGGEVQQACPVCSSFLPDDGVCVQCGDDSVAVERAYELELVNTHSNGNGNGYSNGNGNGTHALIETIDDAIAGTNFTRLRGINS
jgi:hypothetical protein